MVRIDSESSQFSTLRILPLTQSLISPSNIGRDSGIARIKFLRSLKIGQRALPFTAPTVNRRTSESCQSIVGLQLQRAVELRQRILVLAMTPIKE
jgi:hypothetical protein